MTNLAMLLVLVSSISFAQRRYPAIQPQPLSAMFTTGDITAFVARGMKSNGMALVSVSVSTKNEQTVKFRITINFSDKGTFSSVSADKSRDWTFGTLGTTQEIMWIPSTAKISSIDIAEEAAPAHVEMMDPEN